MQVILSSLILLFGIGSYVAGSTQILQDKYKPSLFSRAVWLLLAVNSFAGVVASDSSGSSVLLSAIFLLGNAVIFLLSIWKGTRQIGKLELVCAGLLLISGLLWVAVDTPLINLGIGLLAHFIGAVPTYKRVWHDGSSESAAFWSLFFTASVLGVVSGLGEPASKLLFPIYFALFDGSMTYLSLRKAK